MKRLLLIGWDSADWKLIHPLLDDDRLPGVQQLVVGGAGGNLTTLEPQLSPMLWTSIATGKMAYHHGVHGFTEVDPVSQQVIPVSAATRQCKTVWEMLGEHGIRSHVVGWFATQGERDLDGCMVSNMYGHLNNVSPDQEPESWPEPPPGTYWPESLAEGMNEHRVSPFEIDPDQVLRAFVPEAAKVDQQRDRKLWHLAEKLAEAYSVQAAATYVMEKDPDWQFMAVYFRALDEIKHIFMHFHPPRMAGIPERDFEIYKDVVTRAYQAHDMMLQRLIQLAGPDTAVVLVSDHGFHCDHLRPKFTPRVPAGITVWHRPQGVFAASGPGFKRDELIFGARLLDVTPTLLHYFGLPVGEDMEGRVLTEAFTDERTVETISSWETQGEARRPRGTLSEAENRSLLDQFVALGYISEVSEDPTEAAAETHRENNWNLARACLYGGKYEMALPLLEDCYESYPERTDYAQQLAMCQLYLGLLDEAEATLEGVLESFGRTEGAHLLRATIALEKGDSREALTHLEAVGIGHEELKVLIPLGRTYLSLRRWDDAETTAHRILKQDPNNAQANLILARTHLHRGDSEQAASWALEAIGHQYGNSSGHFLLGVSLTQEQMWEKAVTALANTVQLEPTFYPAYRHLSGALRALGRHEEAQTIDLRMVTGRRDTKIEREERIGRIRTESAERALTRQEARRRSREESARSESQSTAEEPMELVLVSGLPRSGTSLMMQMLQAGGMELMTDGEREADNDNPMGYWEWEAVKELPKNPRVLEEAKGKVVKVISALLPHLPLKHRYKIIFMRRPESEVVSSQWKMLENRCMKPRSERQHLEQTQAQHVEQVLERLRVNARVELLELEYPDLVRNPKPFVDKLRDFMGSERLPSKDKMAAVVRPELYRNRKSGTNE